MIKAGFANGPLSGGVEFDQNSTDNRLVLIRFLGTFLRVKSLSPTTYISDMSEFGMWLNMREKRSLNSKQN